MAENSQYPGFVKIDYHSAYAPHSMEICHNGWNYSGGSPESGTFNAWDSSEIEADVMINALVDTLADFHLATTVYDFYTIYTMEDEDADPVPVYANTLGVAGESTETEWAKAISTTFNIKTVSFADMKIVLLDTPSASGFDKILSFDASVAALDVMDQLTAETNAWSGRANSRPGTLKSITFNLDQALRHQYRMG
jgi:hypothetical protein